MTRKNDGGPAFPAGDVFTGTDREVRGHQPGMTLRQWYAGIAMIATIREEGTAFEAYPIAAEAAVGMADALLVALGEKS